MHANANACIYIYMIFSYIDPVCKRLNLYFCCEESWWKLGIKKHVFWLEEVHHIYRFGFLDPHGGPGQYKHINTSQALMADTASSSAAWPQPLQNMINAGDKRIVLLVDRTE